ncbi:hypothetical protein D3C75_738200 [compost metagenome]
MGFHIRNRNPETGLVVDGSGGSRKLHPRLIGSGCPVDTACSLIEDINKFAVLVVRGEYKSGVFLRRCFALHNHAQRRFAQHQRRCARGKLVNDRRRCILGINEALPLAVCHGAVTLNFRFLRQVRFLRKLEHRVGGSHPALIEGQIAFIRIIVGLVDVIRPVDLGLYQFIEGQLLRIRQRIVNRRRAVEQILIHSRPLGAFIPIVGLVEQAILHMLQLADDSLLVESSENIRNLIAILAAEMPADPILQELIRLILVLLHVPAITDEEGHLGFLGFDIAHIQDPGLADIMLPGLAELLSHQGKGNGAEPQITLVHRSPIRNMIV